MYADIIVLALGAIAILIAILGSIKSNEASGTIIGANTRIALGVFGILLLMYGGYSFGTLNVKGQVEQFERGNVMQVNYPVERVQVISPLDGDSVMCRILTMGVYPEGHEKDIWVLLRPSDNFFYPQSDHTNTSYKRNGEWQVITRFGGDEGESYDLFVYEADAEASRFFSDTIQQWKDDLSYPGLTIEEIPDGAVEVDRITVSLKDNCRGVF